MLRLRCLAMNRPCGATGRRTVVPPPACEANFGRVSAFILLYFGPARLAPTASINRIVFSLRTFFRMKYICKENVLFGASLFLGNCPGGGDPLKLGYSTRPVRGARERPRGACRREAPSGLAVGLRRRSAQQTCSLPDSAAPWYAPEARSRRRRAQLCIFCTQKTAAKRPKKGRDSRYPKMYILKARAHAEHAARYGASGNEQKRCAHAHRARHYYRAHFGARKCDYECKNEQSELVPLGCGCSKPLSAHVQCVAALAERDQSLWITCPYCLEVLRGTHWNHARGARVNLDPTRGAA
jgi:hypothetical protein